MSYLNIIKIFFLLCRDSIKFELKLFILYFVNFIGLKLSNCIFDDWISMILINLTYWSMLIMNFFLQFVLYYAICRTCYDIFLINFVWVPLLQRRLQCFNFCVLYFVFYIQFLSILEAGLLIPNWLYFVCVCTVFFLIYFFLIWLSVSFNTTIINFYLSCILNLVHYRLILYAKPWLNIDDSLFFMFNVLFMICGPFFILIGGAFANIN